MSAVAASSAALCGLPHRSPSAFFVAFAVHLPFAMQLPSDNNTPVRTAASPPRARIVVVAVVVESVAAAVVVGCLTKNPRCSHRFSRVPRVSGRVSRLPRHKSDWQSSAWRETQVDSLDAVSVTSSRVRILYVRPCGAVLALTFASAEVLACF